MTKYSNIFIKNIYYMLAYSFQNLRKICDDAVETESFENIQDLLSVILYKGIYSQIKRGIYKDYIEEQDLLSCVKGKINFSESINTASIVNKKLVCQFDEYCENTYLNQVLKSTLDLLIRKGNIKGENKNLLRKIFIYFSQVDLIDIKHIAWSKLSYHRNNITYKMLINICYLIINGLLITEDNGSLKLNQYLDDRYMHKLYEKFILEFYRKHYPEFNPSASYIDWNVEETDGLEFLPNMQSDIMLNYTYKTLIIDAKFYSHTMQTQYDKKSFISANLYQIYTYVKNKDKKHTGNVSGMLLYAKTDEDIFPNNKYKMDGNEISVETLDLNCEWKYIYKRLTEIANEFKMSVS